MKGRDKLTLTSFSIWEVNGKQLMLAYPPRDASELQEGKKRLQNEKEQLREKELQLREEKRQLREQQRQLREEKLQIPRQILVQEGSKYNDTIQYLYLYLGS